MADKIQVAYDTTAVNLYAVIRNAAAQPARADTQVFEDYVTANLTSTKYAIALTEQGTASRYYAVSFPSWIAAGIYAVTIYLRAGANPAETDTPITGGSIDWDGTNIIPLSSRLAPTVAGRTLDVSTTGETGLDFDNIKDATGAHTLTNIRVPNVTLTDTLTTYTSNTPQTGDNYAKINDGTIGLAAIKGFVDDIGVAGAGLTALGDTRIANLDATVSSRLATSGYTAPDNTSITGIKTVTDHLATALELDSGNYRFTVAALANAPTGGGGGTDVNIVSVNGTTFTGPNIPSKLADGVAHGGALGSSTATLALQALTVHNDSGDAAVIESTGGGYGLACRGISGIQAYSQDADGIGLEIESVNGTALSIFSNGAGSSHAALIRASASGKHGLSVIGGTNGSAASWVASGTAPAFDITNSGGDALRSRSTGGQGCGAVFRGHGSQNIIHTRSGLLLDGGGDGLLALGGPTNTWAIENAGAGIIVQGYGDTPGAEFLASNDASAGPSIRIYSPFNATAPTGALEVLTVNTAGGDAIRIAAAGAGKHDINLVGDGKIWNGINNQPVSVLSERVMFSGVLGDQSAGSVDVIILPSGPAGIGVLNGSRLQVYSGVGQYEERTIISWNGTTKEAVIDHPWFAVQPASGDLFHVLYDNSHWMDGSGNVLAVSTVSAFTIGALSQLFTVDSTKIYADAINGSVVKEIANNVNIRKVNNVSVIGVGTSGDPWNPA